MREWTAVVPKHYGFGYVSSADDDFKLVLLETLMPRVSGDVNVFIFSMRVNSWKVIKVEGWLAPPQSGIFLNEAIHWVYYGCGKKNTLLEQRRQMQIYAFDLVNEESRQFPGPHFNQDEDNGIDHATYSTMGTVVVPLGGCLCILYQQTWYSVEGMEIELWKMTDYGVSDSWMKFLKFRSNDLPDVFELNGHGWKPIVFREDGTFVIKLPKTKELVRLECRQGEKPVCRDRYRLEELPGYEVMFDYVTLYDETLLSATQ